MPSVKTHPSHDGMYMSVCCATMPPKMGATAIASPYARPTCPRLSALLFASVTSVAYARAAKTLCTHVVHEVCEKGHAGIQQDQRMPRDSDEFHVAVITVCTRAAAAWVRGINRERSANTKRQLKHTTPNMPSTTIATSIGCRTNRSTGQPPRHRRAAPPKTRFESRRNEKPHACVVRAHTQTHTHTHTHRQLLARLCRCPSVA